MANLHQVVVDDVGQVIGGQLVGTLVEHLVIDDVALHVYLAANQVVHLYVPARLNLEAHHVLVAVGYQPLCLFLRQRERIAHLATRLGVVLEVLYLPALLLQFLGCVKGYVSLVAVEQLSHVHFIYIATLALAIRTLVAAERHSLVELDAEPAERLDDVFLGTRHETV